MAKAEPISGSAFSLVCAAISLDGASAADEVHDDGDEREDQQEMNEKAADVQHEKTTQPKNYKHNRQN
jgi:hypothetical protein